MEDQPIIDSSSQSQRTPAVLFHTTDGGHTWNEDKSMNSHKFSPSSSLISHYDDYYESVNRIHIVNSIYGFYMLNGEYIDFYHGMTIEWIIVNSLDGVHYWKEDCFVCGNLWGIDLYFTDSLHGWILKRDGESNPYPQVLYTEKGIESLAVISVVDSPLYVDVSRMDFIDSLQGWIISSKKVYHTVDGGYNWVAESIVVVGNLGEIDFLDSLNGWVSGNIGTRGIILRTRDGGNNWTQELTPITYYVIRSLYFVDTLNGWAVGDNGKILHYTTVGVEEDRFFADAQNDRLEVEPNLCSSVVKINYSVDREKDISLTIYDVTGRLIEVLVDGKIDQGSYQIDWTTTGLPRGIYFAKLVTPTRKITKKLILTP
ncbi:MAG: T9SS type A sorting domain-containing protein [Candidatus Stahlbacteria bacterium]|nr:T9SS type A sorting domain-containing protein [Candidatus Stahlbacteria bacterium]